MGAAHRLLSRHLRLERFAGRAASEAQEWRRLVLPRVRPWLAGDDEGLGELGESRGRVLSTILGNLFFEQDGGR